VSGGKAADVCIHEMIIPPEISAMHAAHLPVPDYSNEQYAETVQRMK